MLFDQVIADYLIKLLINNLLKLPCIINRKHYIVQFTLSIEHSCIISNT